MPITPNVGDEPIRVIISVRVSSEDQKEKGWGHKDQFDNLPKLVEQQGWVLAERPNGTPAIYDEGATSTTPGADDELGLESRPVLVELLSELSHTRPTWLVCRKLDRLTRDSYQYEFLTAKLLKAGVSGYAQFPAMRGAPELREIDNPNTRLFASVEAAFAAHEKAELKRKLMNSRRTRSAAGLPNGGKTPYGYRRSPDKNAPFEVEPEEKRVYLQLIKWALKGHGPAYMANQLVRRNIPTRSGPSNWSATTVRKLLQNESQTGFVRARFDGKDSWVKAEHEPLVSRERWEAAQAVLASRRRESGDSQKRHALAGLLRCSSCGKTLKARVTRKPKKGGGRYEYWGYSCKVYSSGCSAGYYISEERAFDELALLIDARLAVTTDWVEPRVVDDLAPLHHLIEQREEERETARRRLLRTEARYDDAPEEHLGRIAQEIHARQGALAEAEARLAEARAELARATNVAPSPDLLKLAELRDLLSDWRSWEDDNDKRALLEEVIDRAVVHRPGKSRGARRLEVEWRSG